MTDIGTDFDLVGSMIDYEAGELDGMGMLELFSNLITSGMINGLQGSYFRQALALIESGWLSVDGTILRYPEDEEEEG